MSFQRVDGFRLCNECSIGGGSRLDSWIPPRYFRPPDPPDSASFEKFLDPPLRLYTGGTVPDPRCETDPTIDFLC